MKRYIEMVLVTAIGELKRGDIVRHVAGDKSKVIADNDGKHAIAVDTTIVFNPSEWRKVVRVTEGSDDTHLLRDVDGCIFAGPGRGDCENAVGFPGQSIPGQHDGDDDTVDAYGKPNGWCWSCWKSHQIAEQAKRIEELEAEIDGRKKLIDSMEKHGSHLDEQANDNHYYIGNLEAENAALKKTVEKYRETLVNISMTGTSQSMHDNGPSEDHYRSIAYGLIGRAARALEDQSPDAGKKVPVVSKTETPEKLEAWVCHHCNTFYLENACEVPQPVNGEVTCEACKMVLTEEEAIGNLEEVWGFWKEGMGILERSRPTILQCREEGTRGGE